MGQWNLRSGRKTTGGKYKTHGKKTRALKRRDFLPTHLGGTKSIEKRTRGGSTKRILLKTETANIAIKGKYQKAKILSVLKNPADLQFVRRNIITKGAIIQTDLGKAKVLSRPGQSGTIDAILIEEKK